MNFRLGSAAYFFLDLIKLLKERFIVQVCLNIKDRCDTVIKSIKFALLSV